MEDAMSTRSTIAYVKPDGGVQVAKCHFDGHTDVVGYALYSHYNSIEAIGELLKYGDYRYISVSDGVLSVEKYDDSPSAVFKNFSEYLKKNYNEDFNYVFKDNKWQYRAWSGEWKVLETAIKD
jgi:hypothetical protein